MGLGSLVTLKSRNRDYWRVSLMSTLSSEHSRKTCGTQELPCKKVFSLFPVASLDLISVSASLLVNFLIYLEISLFFSLVSLWKMHK